MNISQSIQVAGPITSLSSANTPVGQTLQPIENGRNLAWPKAKPWLESRMQTLLDTSGRTSQRERALANNDIITWAVAGPKDGRAEDEAALSAFLNQTGDTDISQRIHALGDMNSLTMQSAYAAGKNGITASIAFIKNLSESDREIIFTAATTVDKDGRYAYKTEAEFYSFMERLESEWTPPPPTDTSRLSRDEAASYAQLLVSQSQVQPQLNRLKADYNNRFGSVRTVTDTIELSGPGAKAAAKTLQTDGANDVALKALETLKQVGEQQREWAKSLTEEDATEPSATASNVSNTPVAANIVKPGSVLSIAA